MIRRISILLFIGLCWGQEIVEIKTGSFFGMCSGYCLSELTITESQADYNIYGWDLNDPVYLPIAISDSLDSFVWENLNAELNFELFMSLDSIIGCPDCVDGGAEWFEIITNDTVKRVTIEYGESLNGLDGYINLLRTIRQSIEEIQKCYYTPNPGVCLAAITKYYFDQEENECLEFTWGGCGGLVPFETMDDCESSCIDDGQQLSTHISHYPAMYELKNCYPNPFNPVTTLRYDLPEDAMVNITIYDMMGRIVNNLVSSQQNTGYKSVQWNATNNAGQPVSAGLYLYTIQAGEFRQVRKMVLLK